MQTERVHEENPGPDDGDELEPDERPGRRTMRDMVISLVVLLIPVLLVVAVYRLKGGEDPVVIDPSAPIGQAQEGGAFPVSVPRGLAEGWRPISAGYRGGATAVLRIGYLTPSGGGAQLIESNEPAESLLRRELGDQVRPTGTVDIDGRSWQSYDVRDGERALVQTDPARTLIVIGRAQPDELRELARAVN